MDGVLVLNRPKRALVAYSMSSTFVQTTLDYLVAFEQFSGFDVSYVHVTQNALVEFDFDAYDVVFHSYCARLCFEGYVSDTYQERLRNFSGVKVLAVQDEYDRTDTLKAAIKKLGFDIVLTCVPQDSLEYVYPRSDFPDVDFITVFTGYVPDNPVAGLPPVKPLADRSIFLGYRGRDIGGRYGRLGFDKFEIGRRMKELCDERGIQTDIAMDEASRIYGAAWFDFVGECRAMLGSESGSNVFDFDGSIDARFKEMTVANGGISPSYADFLPIVEVRDGEIEMGQISPRVFECAIMRTPMVLFKGRYSDAILPNEHYIALYKDFSNLDEVLARLADLPALDAMTQRAFDHLVGSGRFSYRTFYAGVAEAIERRAAAKIGQREALTAAGAAPATAALFNEAGLMFERPTPRPLGEQAFQMRHGLAESLVYRGEFERLVGEFTRLRSLFEAEMARLYTNYESELRQLDLLNVTAETPPVPSPGRLEDSELMRLLVRYDAESAAVAPSREDTSAAFRTAFAAGDQEAASEALRRMLAIEKDGYFRMIEWISDINRVYDVDRAKIEQNYVQTAEFVSSILPHLSFWRRCRMVLISLRLRFRRLRSTLLRRTVRRLLAVLPSISPLAQRIAIRLKSNGIT